MPSSRTNDFGGGVELDAAVLLLMQLPHAVHYLSRVGIGILLELKQKKDICIK